MREIDRSTTERFGVPSLTLMENAGTAVAKFVASRYPSAKKIAVVCGKGNNGGDGFVAARKLREMGKDIHVLLLAKPGDLQGDAAAMFSQLSVQALLVLEPADFEKPEVRAAMESFASTPQERKLPSAPVQPVQYMEEKDRPQPRKDVERDRGMACFVGRLRECNVLGYKFVALGHNTVRGAAGAAVLNAELMHSEGLLN